MSTPRLRAEAAFRPAPRIEVPTIAGKAGLDLS